jgi:hypothetical protein
MQRRGGWGPHGTGPPPKPALRAPQTVSVGATWSMSNDRQVGRQPVNVTARPSTASLVQQHAPSHSCCKRVHRLQLGQLLGPTTYSNHKALSVPTSYLTWRANGVRNTMCGGDGMCVQTFHHTAMSSQRTRNAQQVCCGSLAMRSAQHRGNTKLLQAGSSHRASS